MPAENDSEKPKAKKSPGELPENTKKLIFIAALAISMTIVVSLWLLSLKSILTRPAEKSEDKNLVNIRRDLENFLGETKNYFSSLSEQIKPAEGQSRPLGLSAAEVEKLKQKLIAKETGTWRTYLDADYKFEIKYPENWRANVWPNNPELIVSFRPQTNSAELVTIKKLASTADILKLPNAKKYWPIAAASGRRNYLVIFDYLNNTTSDLIINTFNFIK